MLAGLDHRRVEEVEVLQLRRLERLDQALPRERCTVELGEVE